MISRLVRRLPGPARSRLYGWCRRVVDLCDGLNNPDIATNGELRVLRQVIPSSRVVFDVGANVGDWAAAVLGLNPGVELHCFEPSRASHARLAERRLPGNVVCNPFGLSSESRQARLFVFAATSAMNSLYRREGLQDVGLEPPREEERVELRTLDNYCRDRSIQAIDYLKVDVEGHELEVLRGGSGMLKDGRVRFVQFEYGGCNIDARILLKDIFEFLRPFPYECHKILPARLESVAAYSQRLENFQYSNWLLVRRGERVTDVARSST